eukprot:Sspe_Gene.28331::Locus_12767_Transcript_1_1_Confidence_1.000_Length_2538::g.28331::m.28331
METRRPVSGLETPIIAPTAPPQRPVAPRGDLATDLLQPPPAKRREGSRHEISPPARTAPPSPSPSVLSISSSSSAVTPSTAFVIQSAQPPPPVSQETEEPTDAKRTAKGPMVFNTRGRWYLIPKTTVKIRTVDGKVEMAMDKETGAIPELREKDPVLLGQIQNAVQALMQLEKTRLAMQRREAQHQEILSMLLQSQEHCMSRWRGLQEDLVQAHEDAGEVKCLNCGKYTLFEHEKALCTHCKKPIKEKTDIPDDKSEELNDDLDQSARLAKPPGTPLTPSSPRTPRRSLAESLRSTKLPPRKPIVRTPEDKEAAKKRISDLVQRLKDLEARLADRGHHEEMLEQERQEGAKLEAQQRLAFKWAVACIGKSKTATLMMLEQGKSQKARMKPVKHTRSQPSSAQKKQQGKGRKEGKTKKKAPQSRVVPVKAIKVKMKVDRASSDSSDSSSSEYGLPLQERDGTVPYPPRQHQSLTGPGGGSLRIPVEAPNEAWSPCCCAALCLVAVVAMRMAGDDEASEGNPWDTDSEATAHFEVPTLTDSMEPGVTSAPSVIEGRLQKLNPLGVRAPVDIPSELDLAQHWNTLFVSMHGSWPAASKKKEPQKSVFNPVEARKLGQTPCFRRPNLASPKQPFYHYLIPQPTPPQSRVTIRDSVGATLYPRCLDAMSLDTMKASVSRLSTPLKSPSSPTPPNPPWKDILSTSSPQSTSEPPLCTSYPDDLVVSGSTFSLPQVGSPFPAGVKSPPLPMQPRPPPRPPQLVVSPTPSRTISPRRRPALGLA